MKKRSLTLLIILFGMTVFGNPKTPLLQAAGDTLLVLKNAQFLDVKRGKMVAGKDIVVSNGRIIAIQKPKTYKGNVKIIDLQGKFITPGLIDGHVHVTAPYKNRMETTFSHLNYFLLHGITSVRDAGGDGQALLAAKTAIEQQKKQGPNVYFSSFMAGDWYYNRGQNLHQEAYTAWQQRLVPGMNLDSAMAMAKACGATGVKLYHSFDNNFLLTIVKAAKRNGLKVWAHTMLYPANPVQVAQSGVEVLSHVSMLETLATDSIFRRRTTTNAYRDSVIAGVDITEFCKAMKKRHAILDATLCVSVDRDPWVLPLLKRVHEQGVLISSGTDQIVDLNSAYPKLIDELNYFVNSCGFSTADALRSATLIGAKVVGDEKNIGSIEKGKLADLLVLDKNPLLHINALKKIAYVFKAGKLVNSDLTSK